MLQGEDQQSGGGGAVEAFMARKDCYRQICMVLQRLYTVAACHPQLPSVPKSPGPVVQQQQSADSVHLNPMEAQRLADATLELTLQSNDELCHVAVFDWLTDNHWDDKLLGMTKIFLLLLFLVFNFTFKTLFTEIQSPYLENYLKRQTLQNAGEWIIQCWKLCLGF